MIDSSVEPRPSRTPLFLTDPEADSVRFRFRCLGHLFQAWTRKQGDGTSLCVSSEVGHLPYSAENHDGRRTALMLLSRAGSIADTRLLLTEFHCVSVISHVAVEDDRDPVALVGQAASAVMKIVPLIALLSDCLVTPERPADA